MSTLCCLKEVADEIKLQKQRRVRTGESVAALLTVSLAPV